MWIAERFTDEHRAALDWLSEITDERFNFFGLEIEIWRIGDSPLAPKFNVVSSPNDWTKTISGAAKQIQSNDLSDLQKLQHEYWKELRLVMEEHGGRVRPTKPRPQHWLNCSIGRSGFTLGCLVNSRDNRISVELTIVTNDSNAYFHLLREDSDLIESDLGHSLEWKEMAGKKSCRIVLSRDHCDFSDRDDWPTQHAWMHETLNAFHAVFSDRVRNLQASDYKPEFEE